MAARNTDRVRYRYGICLNDNCEKCKSKEVQEVPARKDFVCQNPECGKPLRECPPPKQGGNGKLIGIIAGVVVLLALIGGIFAFSGSDEEKTVAEPVKEAPVAVDSVKAAEPEPAPTPEAVPDPEKKAEPKEVPAPKPASSGSKNLGYATFKGSWPNDVNGRMVFTSSHIIDSKDPKNRVAEAGDYVIGEWSDGHLVQGIWYGADNQVKGSIIIGK